MAKFCTNCGHALDAGATFCSYCGAPLGEQAAQQPAQPQAQPWQQQPQQQAWQQQAQPQQQAWQQPAQTSPWPPQAQQQPPQWQQPTGQWSAPRTQQAQPWQQPTAANEWHPAPGSAGSGWTAPPSASRAPGARITEAWENYQDARAAEKPAPSRPAPAGGARAGIPAPGWSDRVNDPELLAALAKQKKVSGRVSAFIVPLPLVGFLIYGLVSDEMEITKALLIGLVVSAVFWIFSRIGKRQTSGKNAYEGMVVDKQTRQRRHSNGGDDNGRRSYSYYTELITVVQTSGGETKRIVERDDNRTFAWDYLQVGDRFRYHPEYAFPYELYDKSHAPYIHCVVCQKKNPTAADRCKKCGAPLLK